MNSEVAVEKEKTKRTTITIVLIVAAIILILAICCGSCVALGYLGDKNTDDTSDTISTSDSTDQTDNMKTYSRTDEVTIDNLKIKVTDVQSLGSSISRTWGDPITTTGTFIRVDFEVENLGSDAQYMGKLQLVDSSARTFEESEKRYSVLGDEANFLDKLNPNVNTNYATVFDVPTDAKGLKLKTNGFGLFNSKYVLIDLGIDAA